MSVWLSAFDHNTCTASGAGMYIYMSLVVMMPKMCTAEYGAKNRAIVAPYLCVGNSTVNRITALFSDSGEGDSNATDLTRRSLPSTSGRRLLQNQDQNQDQNQAQFDWPSNSSWWFLSAVILNNVAQADAGGIFTYCVLNASSDALCASSVLDGVFISDNRAEKGSGGGLASVGISPQMTMCGGDISCSNMTVDSTGNFAAFGDPDTGAATTGARFIPAPRGMWSDYPPLTSQLDRHQWTPETNEFEYQARLQLLDENDVWIQGFGLSTWDAVLSEPQSDDDDTQGYSVSIEGQVTPFNWERGLAYWDNLKVTAPPGSTVELFGLTQSTDIKQQFMYKASVTLDECTVGYVRGPCTLEITNRNDTLVGSGRSHRMNFVIKDRNGTVATGMQTIGPDWVRNRWRSHKVSCWADSDLEARTTSAFSGIQNVSGVAAMNFIAVGRPGMSASFTCTVMPPSGTRINLIDMPRTSITLDFENCIQGEIYEPDDYNPLLGRCEPCPKGSYSLALESTHCTFCNPVKLQCFGGKNFSAMPGWFVVWDVGAASSRRSSSTAVPSGVSRREGGVPASIEVISCPNDKACLFNNTCRRGYHGVQCAKCDDGNFPSKDPFECVKCPNPVAMVFCKVLVTFVLFIIGAKAVKDCSNRVYEFLNANDVHEEEEDNTAEEADSSPIHASPTGTGPREIDQLTPRRLTSPAQGAGSGTGNSQAGLRQKDDTGPETPACFRKPERNRHKMTQHDLLNDSPAYSGVLKAAIGYMVVINTLEETPWAFKPGGMDETGDVAQGSIMHFSVICLGFSDFGIQLAIAACIVPAYIVFCAIFAVCAQKLGHPLVRYLRNDAFIDEVRMATIAIFFVFFSFSMADATGFLFRIIPCFNAPGDQRRMSHSPDDECYHSAYMIEGVLLIVVYIGGGFGTCWYFLNKIRGKTLLPKIIARYGFLYQDYTPPNFYWELVMVVNKVAIEIITIVYPISTSGPTRLPVLVAVQVAVLYVSLNLTLLPFQTVFLSLHMIHMPFRIPAVNRVRATRWLYLMCAFQTQFVALLGSIIMILTSNYVTIDVNKVTLLLSCAKYVALARNRHNSCVAGRRYLLATMKPVVRRKWGLYWH